MNRVVIIGGGPGGYESALVAASLGAQVTLIERNGCGGSAVLTDVVPSKALIAVAEAAIDARGASVLGLNITNLNVDIAATNKRLLKWARNQSNDIAEKLQREGVRIIDGSGKLLSENQVLAVDAQGQSHTLDADIILLATGARPRELETAKPDGERIFTWEQLYSLCELPEHLIVVGSGVTGAEFASAYQGLGAQVTLVSSRDQVLPGEDSDAAGVIEDAFAKRGMTVLSNARALTAQNTGSGVEVSLADGTVLKGSHCLMAVGSLPNTEDLGLAEVGIETNAAGQIVIDRVSRTNVRGIYAAGDCTGVFMLASVAAMQGRIAMWHALGDAVNPLDLNTVASNVFTDPEIATVGVSQADVVSGNVDAVVVKQSLAGNARAKMQGSSDGFIKLFATPGSHTIIGGVVVAPKASELIYSIALAVKNRLTVEQLAETITVYPSITGSLAEAARRLRVAE